MTDTRTPAEQFLDALRWRGYNAIDDAATRRRDGRPGVTAHVYMCRLYGFEGDIVDDTMTTTKPVDRIDRVIERAPRAYTGDDVGPNSGSINIATYVIQNVYAIAPITRPIAHDAGLETWPYDPTTLLTTVAFLVYRRRT